MKKEEKNKDDDIWRGNSDLNLGEALTCGGVKWIYIVLFH
jgi:hypothetical protein